MPSQSTNLNKFFDKLDQLRELVAFGQKVMPVVEELFGFIREIAPLMEDINHSLRDSTGKIPRATSQIQRVSQATELATTEILDLVDSAIKNTRRLEERLERSGEHVAKVRDVDERLIALLRERLGDEHDDLLEQVEQLHAEKQELDSNTHAEIEGEQELLKELRNQSTQIMMALQVQDITSQQLAAVTHLIESIRTHLSSLVRRLEEEPWDEPEEMPEDDGTFNPHAIYDPSGRLQDAADAVAEAYQRGDDIPDVEAPKPPDAALPASDVSSGDGAGTFASQDDIDDLFGSFAAAADDEPADADEPASQDDIDDLFAGNAPSADEPSEPASQDDIDALFGGGL